MTKFRNNLTSVCLFALLCAFTVEAQTTAADRAVLESLRKQVEAGKLAEAERDLLKYVIGHPSDAAGFSLLAGLRLKQERFGEAQALSAKALALDPALASAKITSAAADVRLGNGASARAKLNSIPEKEMADDATRQAVAEGLASAGDCPAALELISKLPPKIRNGAVLPVRAGCYLESGDRQALSSLVPLAKTVSARSPEIGISFAEVLVRGGMLRETLDLLTTVIAAAPRETRALLLLARTEIGLREFVPAKQHIERARTIAPDAAETFFVGSMLESALGNNAKAFELLEEALRRVPDNIEYLARFVVVAMRASQPAKALKAAEVLLASQPENPDVIYLHGAAALQANNIPTAEASLVRFASIRPNDSRGCLALGLTYAAQADKLEMARQKMESCLVIDPGNFEAAYQLGLFYKTQGDAAKAVEYLEKTVSLSPDYSAALRDLGASLMQTGDEAGARKALEKAVRLEPNDADTHFQLSRLYNMIGERELGKKHLEIFQKLKNPKQTGM